ncbi:HECT [Macleaya cordata]|uniref:HECT-type E3 ubiquitin transferase n=1 Tax=Macleaya cordata TaxID=56857 RepID=A0A200PNT1_MACCD|nr:HECT [Macleaya cordata]
MDELMRSKEHVQTTKTVEDLVSSINRLCYDGSDESDFLVSSCTSGGDYDESSSRIDIVSRVKDFLRMIPRDNKKKSMEHLQIFEFCGAPEALVSLFESHIEGNKEIGEESIRLFLINPKSKTGFLPRSITNQCASIVLEFYGSLRGTAAVDDKCLYHSCRKTLISILKSIAFANRSKYFGNAEPTDFIKDLYPFFFELWSKLLEGLDLISESGLCTVSTRLRLSFASDIREFALYSFHLRRAIEDHVRSKGQSLPLSVENNFKEHPCYNIEIESLHRDVFPALLLGLVLCLYRMRRDIGDGKGIREFNHAWSYYLSIMKELNNISKLYQGAEEDFSSDIQAFQVPIGTLIAYSKRSDDNLWLLKHKDVISFYPRRYLMMLMFPEVKDDQKKLHKILIDRSHLLTESFEHIAHANPKSLRNGLSVEFKNEIATGHGVLREWLYLICQELFNPQNSLFLACPNDRRRFFPNPVLIYLFAANVDPQHLTYFRLCGRVIALALMHNIQVGIAFDRMFFLQLAEEVISLEDVRYADPCMYKSCKMILEMDVNFMDSDAMGLTFVNEIEEFGSRKIVELCPGGNTIIVNSKNREKYVDLLIQHRFVKSISRKVAYFARGFGDILYKRRHQKIFFQSVELEDLDCMLLGSDKGICVEDWKAHTCYDDYKETDDQICWFWKVVEGMSLEQQRELLFFWTSVKYLPAKGFSDLPSRLYIYKTSGSHYRMPSSHTCFFRLALPQYPSLAVMKQRLLFICQQKVGCSFGFL